MESSTVLIQVIVLIGGIFAGFFALIKYINKNAASTNQKFFDYIEKKNGHLERISDRFSTTVEKNHDVISVLSQKVEKMNDNDAMVTEALRNNSETLNRAVRIIELTEKKEVLKEINLNNEFKSAIQ